MTTAATITQPVSGFLERIAKRERLEHDEWMQVIGEAETEDLRRLADDLRRELHPDNVVTYVVDRNINYSNVCFSVCNFCAFYRKPGHSEGYVLNYDEIFEKVEEMISQFGDESIDVGPRQPAALQLGAQFVFVLLVVHDLLDAIRGGIIRADFGNQDWLLSTRSC